MEETVEISPGPAATRIAQELLAVAAHEGNDYGVNHVATTTFGPQGLAFTVPRGLFELWDAAFNAAVPTADEAELVADEPAAEAEKPKRGRPAKAKETE